MKVLGFLVQDYDRSYLEKLTDIQLNEIFLGDDSVASYDCVKDFFYDLNDDMIDTENRFWFVVNID